MVGGRFVGGFVGGRAGYLVGGLADWWTGYAIVKMLLSSLAIASGVGAKNEFKYLFSCPYSLCRQLWCC